MTTESTAIEGVLLDTPRRKSGPKSRHSGMWKPGQSGNPSGRPKRTPEEIDFQQRCKEVSLDALAYLVDLVGDDTAPVRERREAALAVIHHGHGLPVARNLVASVGGGNPKEISREELTRRILARFPDGITDVRNTE